MLGFHAISEAPISALSGAELGGSASILTSSDLQVLATLVKNGKATFTTSSDLDIFAEVENFGNFISMNGIAELTAKGSMVMDVKGINIDGKTHFVCKGEKLGEGWVRITPSTDEWNNNSTW